MNQASRPDHHRPDTDTRLFSALLGGVRRPSPVGARRPRLGRPQRLAAWSAPVWEWLQVRQQHEHDVITERHPSRHGHVQPTSLDEPRPAQSKMGCRCSRRRGWSPPVPSSPAIRPTATAKAEQVDEPGGAHCIAAAIAHLACAMLQDHQSGISERSPAYPRRACARSSAASVR
jgi:hypothetical protein